MSNSRGHELLQGISNGPLARALAFSKGSGLWASVLKVVYNGFHNALIRTPNKGPILGLY